MKISQFTLFLFLICLLPSCSDNSTSNYPAAEQLALSWELNAYTSGDNSRSKAGFTLINNSNQLFPAQGWTIYFSQMPSKVITESLPDDFVVENIAGDYYKLYPTAAFQGIQAGETKTFTWEKGGMINSVSDAPVGVYIVYEGAEPEVLTNYEAKPINAALLGAFPVPSSESRFQENRSIQKLPTEAIAKIIPRPVSYTETKGKTIAFTNSINIQHKGYDKEAQFLADYLKPLFQGQILINDPNSKEGIITLQRDPSRILLKEGYKLKIDDNGILISELGPSGVFYGIQSLLNLLPVTAYQNPQETLTFNQIKIEDSPRFPYRGMHLDVSRNFHSVATVKKLLDIMAFYKLNKFHFHITDDEGWRLEIEGLPELTEIGSKRGHTEDESVNIYPAYGSGPFISGENHFGSGYYSKSEFIDILQYANDRHIEVILEIDVPGHARAAIKAMHARYNRFMKEGNEASAKAYLLHDFDDKSEYSSAQNYSDNVICICQESAFTFMEKVMDEVVAMYKEAGAPITTIHIGGDEVPHGSWEKSPLCEKFLEENPEIGGVDGLLPYFVDRFYPILEKHGLTTAGWEEILLKKGENGLEVNKDFLGKQFMAYAWNAVWGWNGEDLAYRIANTGFPVVMCNASNYYFDLQANTDPAEPGLNWAGYVDTKSPFMTEPLDLLKTASTDMYGNPLDLDKLKKEKVALNEKGRRFFRGIQGELWSETVRGPEALEYMVFPKLLSLAERAWSPMPDYMRMKDREQRMAAMEQDWGAFANTVGQVHLPILEHLYGGVAYRIPLPGALVENGELRANIRFPGLTIRYTTDGTEPDMNSTEYTEPVKVSGTVFLKAFDTKGRSSRTSVVQGKD